MSGPEDHEERCYLAGYDEDDDEGPCCKPENCPVITPDAKHVVGWGGSALNGHGCCLCWDRYE